MLNGANSAGAEAQPFAAPPTDSHTAPESKPIAAPAAADTKATEPAKSIPPAQKSEPTKAEAAEKKPAASAQSGGLLHWFWTDLDGNP